MKATGIIRYVDHLGRVVIPKELRKQMFGSTNAEGLPVEFFVDDNTIVLKRYDRVCENGE